MRAGHGLCDLSAQLRHRRSLRSPPGPAGVVPTDWRRDLCPDLLGSIGRADAGAIGRGGIFPHVGGLTGHAGMIPQAVRGCRWLNLRRTTRRKMSRDREGAERMRRNPAKDRFLTGAAQRRFGFSTRCSHPSQCPGRRRSGRGTIPCQQKTPPGVMHGGVRIRGNPWLFHFQLQICVSGRGPGTKRLPLFGREPARPAPSEGSGCLRRCLRCPDGPPRRIRRCPRRIRAEASDCR